MKIIAEFEKASLKMKLPGQCKRFTAVGVDSIRIQARSRSGLTTMEFGFMADKSAVYAGFAGVFMV